MDFLILQNGVWLDYFKGLIWAILLGLTILIWPVRTQDKKALLLIWVIKCIVILGPILFYEHYYKTDSKGFFFQAKAWDLGLWKALLESGWHNIPITLVLFAHKHSFFNSFQATNVSFGMIGFVAIYIFYRSVVVFIRQERIGLLYLFALFPSILLWSSTLSKDPLLLLGIAVYCYGVIKRVRFKTLSSAITILTGASFATLMRPWLGCILGIPAFIITIPTITMKNFKWRVAFLIALILITLFSINRMLTGFSIKSLEDLPKAATFKFNTFAIGGSALENNPPVPAPSTAEKDSPAATSKVADKRPNRGIKPRFNSLKDVILFMPEGMFTALFRPLPGEVKNIFGLLAGLEDMLLLVLFSFVLKTMRWRKLSDPVCIWAILLIIIWAGIYEFVGFNLGTIHRYRLQVMPIFLGLLIYLAFGGNKPADMIKNDEKI